MHNPPHPGKVLREFLGDIDVTTAAKHLQVSRATLSRILNGKAGISADMSLRLSAAFGTHAEIGMSCKPTTTCGGHPKKSSRKSSHLAAPRRTRFPESSYARLKTGYNAIPLQGISAA
jgi:addiction module HigA family antidote